MKPPTAPTDPDPRFVEFMAKSQAIEGERLAAAIPREYMQPSASRGLAGFAMSGSLYIGAIVAMAMLDRWYLVVPLVAVAGLGGWGLHCVGHDCGHGSFSRNRRLNFAIGHLALLPLLYPFHAWRHEHNWHHAHANSLELDIDWRPIRKRSTAACRGITDCCMRACAPGRYGPARSTTGSISSFRPSHFPKREMRRDVRRSVWFVIVVGGGYLTLLTYFTGWQGLLLYFVAPWLAIHTWFSITTLMHHSSEDIPYLPEECWTRNASKLLVTTDYVYPRWLLFLTHNISLHTAHHVAPAMPYYNLRKAQVGAAE